MNFPHFAKDAAGPAFIFCFALFGALGVGAYATTPRQTASMTPKPLNPQPTEVMSATEERTPVTLEKREPQEEARAAVALQSQEKSPVDRISFGNDAFACPTENGVVAVSKAGIAHNSRRLAKIMKSRKCIAMSEGATATAISTAEDVTKFMQNGKILYTLTTMAHRF